MSDCTNLSNHLPQLCRVHAQPLLYCDAEIAHLRAEQDALRTEVEKLQVQLAGCLTAAEGHVSDPATKEMYGWSLAYEQVLQLRIRYEAFLAVARAADLVISSCDLRLLGEANPEGEKAGAALDALYNALAHPAIQKHLKTP